MLLVLGLVLLMAKAVVFVMVHPDMLHMLVGCWLLYMLLLLLLLHAVHVHVGIWSNKRGHK